MNTEQKQHASFIQPALQQLLQSANASFNDIDAVSVVNGPGSYTGLRVGLATAKGICYALNKPLILINTLIVMASAAVEYCNDRSLLCCPLIDARRSEVFTAVYDSDLHALVAPQPMIVDSESFTIFLNEQKVFFFGSGHNKCKKIINHKNAVFGDVYYTMNHINHLSQFAYSMARFANTAYAEPFYTKDFFLPV